MGNLHVKGGTPVGSVSLCGTCSWAQIIHGFRESEMVSICRMPEPNIVLPFRVHECTEYNDRNRPDWEQMTKLAIGVLPASSARPVGFNVRTTVKTADETESTVAVDEED